MNYKMIKHNPKFNRRTLNLHLRAQVIREYNALKPRPSIKSFARKHKVSHAQMKSILLNHERILKCYEEQFDEKRIEEKLQFLCHVMHEYLHRAMQQSIPIDDEQVLQKAKEVAQCMGVGSFSINHSWLDDFKKSFDMKTLQIAECMGVQNFESSHSWLDDFKKFFDTKTPQQYSALVEPKRTELTAFELIAYVSSIEVKPVVNEKVANGKKVSGDAFTSKQITSQTAKISQPPPRNPAESIENALVVNKIKIENDEKSAIIDTQITSQTPTIAQSPPRNPPESSISDPIVVNQNKIESDFEENRAIPTTTISQPPTRNLPESSIGDPILVNEIKFENDLEEKPAIINTRIAFQTPTISEPPPRNPAESIDDSIEIKIENDFEEKPAIINMDISPEKNTSMSDRNNLDLNDISMSIIKSEEEALRHIRLLEEFAMMQDNYRAIGLLTQLELVFKYP